jgi:hypothetical protein
MKCVGLKKERDNASRATLKFPTAVVLGRITKMGPATAFVAQSNVSAGKWAAKLLSF